MSKNPRNVNIAVIDKMMPDMDGIKFLETVKGNNNLKHIPIIIQTGDVGLSQMHEGMEKGAYYYLTKPFMPETLMAILKSAENECNLFDEMASKAVAEQKRIIGLVSKCDFHVKTFSEARFLAAVISHVSVAPQQTARGLMELFFNAIEHGNLEIGFQKKHDCLVSGTYNQEIALRLANERYKNRSVKVCIENTYPTMLVTVFNQGPGFNWRQYMVPENTVSLNLPNGRGIAIARKLMGNLNYNAKGTEAYCKIDCKG
jgi:CheY-like chemotaxis protein